MYKPHQLLFLHLTITPQDKKEPSLFQREATALSNLQGGLASKWRS